MLEGYFTFEENVISGVLERPVLAAHVRKSHKVLEPGEDDIRWRLQKPRIPDSPHLGHQDIRKHLLEG